MLKKNKQYTMEFMKNFGFQMSIHLLFLFYLCMVFKKIVKFLCCFIVCIRDFIKKFCTTMVFYLKKIEIFGIQNFKKIPSFTISFLVFQHFWHFVFYFTYPNFSKNYRIFFYVLLQSQRFYQQFLENSKSSFNKNIDW